MPTRRIGELTVKELGKIDRAQEKQETPRNCKTKRVLKKFKGRNPSNKSKTSKVKKLIKLAKSKNKSPFKIQNDGMRK